AFLSVLTAQAAIALENASLYADRQREEASARFLAEASRKLAASLDPNATLQSIAEVPVPELCDACVVSAHDDAEQLATPVSTGISDAVARRVGEAWRCDAADGSANPGRSLSTDAVRGALAELNLSSWASVPLVTCGRCLGVFYLLARKEEHFGDSLRSLAE